MIDDKLFGVATIGEKGQIVIPVEARKAINLEVGDKLLVISGPGKNGLMLMKTDLIKDMARKMNEKFATIESYVEKNK